MKSTIRVDLDFVKNEPFIQINLASSSGSTQHYLEDAVKLDLADKALNSFLEQANQKGIIISYPEQQTSNRSPQIRLKVDEKKRDGFKVPFHSEVFANFLVSQGIDYEGEENYTHIYNSISPFELGILWGQYISENNR